MQRWNSRTDSFEPPSWWDLYGTKIIASLIAIASGIGFILAIGYLMSCVHPLPSKEEVAKAGIDSQTCKQRLHEVVQEASVDAGCQALLTQLQWVANDYPSCVEAKQYAGFTCKDGGAHGDAR